MTYLTGDEKPSLEEVLEHHGVKGMKWGVVKKNLNEVHAEKVKKGLAINERVASGTGSRADKARVIARSPGGRLATRGLKGTAAKNAQMQRDHLERIAKGDRKASDILAQYGGLTAHDVSKALIRSYKG